MPLPSRIPKGLPPRYGRKRLGDSPKHLAWLRTLPCCVCGNVQDVEVHHLLRADNRPKGMGRKNEDKWAIPLCPSHHRGPDSVHGHGDDEAWLRGNGIDGRALAAALWAATGDDDAGHRLVWRARNG